MGNLQLRECIICGLTVGLAVGKYSCSLSYAGHEVLANFSVRLVGDAGGQRLHLHVSLTSGGYPTDTTLGLRFRGMLPLLLLPGVHFTLTVLHCKNLLGLCIINLASTIWLCHLAMQVETVD